MSSRSLHPQRDEIDRIAKLLIDAWAKAEPDHGVTLHPASYVATFADMARAVVEDRSAKAPKSLLDWGVDGFYDDDRAVHLHGICHATSDGECHWRKCPQLANYQSHCPLDKDRQ